MKKAMALVSLVLMVLVSIVLRSAPAFAQTVDIIDTVEQHFITYFNGANGLPYDTSNYRENEYPHARLLMRATRLEHALYPERYPERLRAGVSPGSLVTAQEILCGNVGVFLIVRFRRSDGSAVRAPNSVCGGRTLSEQIQEVCPESECYGVRIDTREGSHVRITTMHVDTPDERAVKLIPELATVSCAMSSSPSAASKLDEALDLLVKTRGITTEHIIDISNGVKQLFIRCLPTTTNVAQTSSNTHDGDAGTNTDASTEAGTKSDAGLDGSQSAAGPTETHAPTPTTVARERRGPPDYVFILFGLLAIAVGGLIYLAVKLVIAQRNVNVLGAANLRLLENTAKEINKAVDQQIQSNKQTIARELTRLAEVHHGEIATLMLRHRDELDARDLAHTANLKALHNAQPKPPPPPVSIPMALKAPPLPSGSTSLLVEGMSNDLKAAHAKVVKLTGLVYAIVAAISEYFGGIALLPLATTISTENDSWSDLSLNPEEQTLLRHIRAQLAANNVTFEAAPAAVRQRLTDPIQGPPKASQKSPVGAGKTSMRGKRQDGTDMPFPETLPPPSLVGTSLPPPIAGSQSVDGGKKPK